MRLLRSSLFALLVALLLVATARAEDEAAPEVWTFRKGDAVQEVAVTHLAPALRQALRTQFEAQGWTLEGPRPPAPSAPGGGLEKPTQPPAPPPGAPSPELLEDLEALIRGGGRLPEGFVPHAFGPGGSPTAGAGPEAPPPGMLLGLARAAGTLLLRYLDAKADPVRGPVYEEVLREVAGVLAQVGGDAPVEPGPLAMRLVARAMGGLQDPARAPVYREILGILSTALAPIARVPGPVPPPSARPAPLPLDFEAPALRFGGASVHAVGALRSLVVTEVPAGCLAQQMGLVPGDRLLGIDGEPATVDRLRRAAAALAGPGQLTLALDRNGSRLVLQIELDAKDGD